MSAASSTRKSVKRQLNVDAASGSASKKRALDSLQEDREWAAFFEATDHRLLYAWIIDYQRNGNRAEKEVAFTFDLTRQDDANYISTFSSQHRLLLLAPLGAPAVKGDGFEKCLQEYRAVWAQVFAAQAAQLHQNDWPSRPIKEQQRGRPPSSTSAFVPSSAKKLTPPAESAMDDEEEGEGPAQPGSKVLVCHTCATVRHPLEANEVLRQWMCKKEGCGLRGDLPTDHAANQMFIASKMASAARSASASSAAAASSSTQSGQTSDIRTVRKSRMEAEFERLIDEGEDFSKFCLSNQVGRRARVGEGSLY